MALLRHVSFICRIGGLEAQQTAALSEEKNKEMGKKFPVDGKEK
jgi:hypothetical protein